MRETLNLASRLSHTVPMAETFRIGELAKAADVASSTVRFYERQGLLRPSSRSASNYRLYSESDLERLRFIRAAQATGFTLEDVTQLLRPAACGKVQALLEDRLARVGERMKELRHLQKVLRASLVECQEHQESGRCRVVDELTVRAKTPR